MGSYILMEPRWSYCHSGFVCIVHDMAVWPMQDVALLQSSSYWGSFTLALATSVDYHQRDSFD